MNILTDSQPGGLNIHQAHALAERYGYVDPSQRPVGTISIDRAFADVALDATLAIVPVAVSPEKMMQPLSRRSNGYAGRSKTHRYTHTSLPNAQELSPDHPVADKLAKHDEEHRAEVEEIPTVEVRWMSDKEGHGYRTIERSHQDIAAEQERLIQESQLARERLRIHELRSQPYARGFATAPTPDEIVRAEAVLRYPHKSGKGTKRYEQW